MNGALGLFPGGGNRECLCGGGFQGNGINVLRANYWGVWEKGTQEVFALFFATLHV